MEKKINCNCCGKELRAEQGVLVEDAFYIKKEWGYFSNKDGIMQEGTLCEECWDEICRHFQIPLQTTEVTELM